MYKKDDIVVRLDNKYNANEAIGSMYKVYNYDGGSYLDIYYSDNINMFHPELKHIRPATQEEIEAYNNGCRNISELDKYIKEEFEIGDKFTIGHLEYLISHKNPNGTIQITWGKCSGTDYTIKQIKENIKSETWKLVKNNKTNKQQINNKTNEQESNNISKSITVPTKSPKISRSAGVRTSAVSGRRTVSSITRYNPKNKAINSYL